MTTEPGVAEVALGLARLLPVLGRMTTDPLPEEMRDSPGQVVLLHILARRGATNVGDLARETGVTAATTSAMVRKLVSKGLVRREPDPDDWRGVRLVLTDAGRAVMDAFTARRQQVLAGLMERLAPDELAQVQAAVRILSGLVTPPAP